MSGVRLADAMIIWNESEHSVRPIAKVVHHLRGPDDERYRKSWGACSADFIEASDSEKFKMLMIQFINMTVNGGLDSRKLHEIFMDIYEYRKELADLGVVDPGSVYAPNP